MKGNEFVSRQQKLMSEVMTELKNSRSARVEILLITNFVESVLSDFMEFLLESEEARRIPRERIVKILTSRKIIHKELAHDIEIVFKIRDFYAHKVSFVQANNETEKILHSMNCVKNMFLKQNPNWKNLHLTNKIVDVAGTTSAKLIMDFDQMVKEPIRLRTKK